MSSFDVLMDCHLVTVHLCAYHVILVLGFQNIYCRYTLGNYYLLLLLLSHSIVVLLIQVDEAFDFSAKGVDGGKDENAWGPMYINFSLPCTIWMSCDQYF
jgi:hypothetical protein